MIPFNESLYCLYFSFNRLEYKQVEKTGPDHDPEFKVKLKLRPEANKSEFEDVFETINKLYVRIFRFGKNKKPAEIEAAEEMCEGIGLKYLEIRL